MGTAVVLMKQALYASHKKKLEYNMPIQAAAVI
jgi:hypothetical protein